MVTAPSSRGVARAPGAERPMLSMAWPLSLLLLLTSLVVLGAPTLIMIARESWTDEQSQQGPIVLAIGAWLLWRRWPSMQAAGKPGAAVLSALGFIVAGSGYVAGRISGLYLLEAYALYGFGLTAVYALVGWRGLAKGLFPLIFLGFAAPVPFAVGWPVTVNLRLAISQFCVDLLHLMHVNAARDGLTVYLQNYRLEIAQACSGMNSLVALTALGLCYVHIRRDPSLSYYLVILPLIIFFAVLANFARVALLALMTLWLGDAAAQGLLHELLGFVTFAVAMMLTFVADATLARAWPKGSKKAPAS